MPKAEPVDFEQILARARQLELRVMDLQTSVTRLRDEFDADLAARDTDEQELANSA
ncbi:MAG: hypothetical protein AB7U73_14180 [Pirellulales bacterium]